MQDSVFSLRKKSEAGGWRLRQVQKDHQQVRRAEGRCHLSPSDSRGLGFMFHTCVLQGSVDLVAIGPWKYRLRDGTPRAFLIWAGLGHKPD